MLQTPSQGRYPFVYPQCPALAFSGSLTGYWATCLVGYISEVIVNSQFSWHSASVLLKCSRSQLSVDQSFIKFPQPSWPPNWHQACLLIYLPCSLCQLSVVRVLLISFPRLTGTKPACLIGGFRSRATICCTSSFVSES